MDSSGRVSDRQRSIVPLWALANPALTLFLFPHAGGSARSFPGWPQRLPPRVACHAIQLPGRGERLKESPFMALAPVVDSVLAALLPILRPPFVFFGHSMGGLIAFEVTRRLQAMSSPLMPAHLFVSGRPAPHLSTPRKRLYDLPDAELIEELGRLGGVPEAVRGNAELMDLMLPTLRADFTVTQSYSYTPGPPLDIPITALGGTRDLDVSEHQIAGWRDHTTRAFTIHMIEGDHFFINTAMPRVCDILAGALSHILAGTVHARPAPPERSPCP